MEIILNVCPALFLGAVSITYPGLVDNLRKYLRNANVVTYPNKKNTLPVPEYWSRWYSSRIILISLSSASISVLGALIILIATRNPTNASILIACLVPSFLSYWAVHIFLTAAVPLNMKVSQSIEGIYIGFCLLPIVGLIVISAIFLINL